MTRTLEDAERPEDVDLSTSGLDRVDAGLQELIDSGELAGAVTLVARRGQVARRSVLGVDSLESKKPLALDTIFRIFSMTKPVTAVAMMILHDEGRWRPSDPIEKFLPSFKNPKVFDGVDDAGAMKLVDADHAPTLAEIMTHTAGVTYGSGDTAHDKAYREARPFGGANMADFAERIGKLPLAYQPGTKWIYSYAMDVQGAIIEAITGQSLPDFMQQRIFGPLGMKDTGFFVPEKDRARLATLYRTKKDRSLAVMDSPMTLTGSDHLSPPRIPSGGGGLVSTLDDYARFAQMLANKGEFAGVRIVSTEAAAQMMRNHLPDWMLEKKFGIGAQQIRPGFGYGYNGAVFTDPKAAGLPVGKDTYQWDGAAQTWFWVDPTNDLIFVGMIQRLSVLMDQVNCQQLTQKLMADAIM